jgi:acid phosphatase (class A)
MTQMRLSIAVGILLASGPLFAQGSATAMPARSPAAHSAYFIDPRVIDLSLILQQPPAPDSDVAMAELAALHRIESARTPAEIAAAQADDGEEDIFTYRDVMGPGFTAQALPVTAALSEHVHGDEPVASAPLKILYQRPRPYQTDATLHPVCSLTKAHNSYPSGHTISGYLLAFTLVQMVPEKRRQILDRADQYAHNRLVCGLHYQSDIDASRDVAYAVFGYMLASPRFQKELAAARDETRRHLGLPLETPQP